MWPNRSMDVCLVPELLEHVREWRECLADFARVLRPGGVLVLTTNNKLCPVQQEFNLPLYSCTRPRSSTAASDWQ
jgi:2-polyprenyl-6-hydroxyphenyl methylase/3-demethylubiquinone-9 3-methyltransferase